MISNLQVNNLQDWRITILKNRINDFVKTVLEPTSSYYNSELFQKQVPEVASQPSFFTISDPCHKESGDFFLMAEKNGESFICLGDAMGHGSKAARHAEELLRILSTILKKIPAGSASYIMKYCNFLFYMANKTNHNLLNRTADLLISRIDPVNMTLSYCSARINFILVRDGVAYKLEKNRNVIGNIDDLRFNVQNHVISLMKGDLLFMHTDGVVDQFGGENDKKLGSRKLIEFLSSIKENNIHLIEKEVRSFLRKWRAGKDQTDDITLIGVQI